MDKIYSMNKQELQTIINQETKFSKLAAIVYALKYSDKYEDKPPKHGHAQTDWVDKICGL